MQHILSLSIATVFALGFCLSACGGDQCVDECAGDQIRHCTDGVLGDPEDCGNGMMCMTMDDGVQHCMAPMGDDDDSSMDM